MIVFEFNHNLDAWLRQPSSRQKPLMPVPASLLQKFVNKNEDYALYDFKEKLFFKIVCDGTTHQETNNRLFNLAVKKYVVWSTYGLIKLIVMSLYNSINLHKIVKLEYSVRLLQFPILCKLYYLILTKMGINLLVMTMEQYELLLRIGVKENKVDRITIKIDSDYYRKQKFLKEDFKEGELSKIEAITTDEFIICMGDELRDNLEAIKLAKLSNKTLVRISQFGHKNSIHEFEALCSANSFASYHLLQKVSYPCLVTLLKKASLQIVPVDSSWQPAGWTVTCESLVVGVPVILYNGLVYRELLRLGIPHSSLIVVDNLEPGNMASTGAKYLSHNNRGVQLNSDIFSQIEMNAGAVGGLADHD